MAATAGGGSAAYAAGKSTKAAIPIGLVALAFNARDLLISAAVSHRGITMLAVEDALFYFQEGWFELVGWNEYGKPRCFPYVLLF